jgi:hypothetical protein
MAWLMVIPHPWFECRPALLVTGDAPPPETDALGLTAVDKVWASMSDADRHRFHRFTCEGDRSERTIDVIYEMRAAINREGLE